MVKVYCEACQSWHELVIRIETPQDGGYCGAICCGNCGRVLLVAEAEEPGEYVLVKVEDTPR